MTNNQNTEQLNSKNLEAAIGKIQDAGVKPISPVGGLYVASFPNTEHLEPENEWFRGYRYAINNPGWIDVNEVLPDEDGQYLVINKELKSRQIRIWHQDHWQGYFGIESPITHWANMPPLPNPEAKEDADLEPLACEVCEGQGWTTETEGDLEGNPMPVQAQCYPCRATGYRLIRPSPDLAKLKQVREALEKADKQFLFYQRHHAEKGAIGKSNTNGEYADICEKAIAILDQIIGEK